VPVLGVNFGRVGFLTAIGADELERGLARVFAGEYRVLSLPTLEASLNGETETAVNDIVVAGGTLGRMIELDWERLSVPGAGGQVLMLYSAEPGTPAATALTLLATLAATAAQPG